MSLQRKEKHCHSSQSVARNGFIKSDWLFPSFYTHLQCKENEKRRRTNNKRKVIVWKQTVFHSFFFEKSPQLGLQRLDYRRRMRGKHTVQLKNNSLSCCCCLLVFCLCFALIVPPKMLQCSSQSTVKLRRDNQEKQKGVNNNRIDRLNKEWKTTNYEDLQRNRTHEYKEWKKRTKQRRLPKEMMNFSIFYLKKLQRIHREFPVMKD